MFVVKTEIEDLKLLNYGMMSLKSKWVIYPILGINVSIFNQVIANRTSNTRFYSIRLRNIKRRYVVPIEDLRMQELPLC